MPKKASAQLSLSTSLPLAALLLYVQGLLLAWNLGVHFNMTLFILPALLIFIPAMILGMFPLLRLEIAAGRRARKTLPKDVWFPAKQFGWGWGPPCTWQGWVVLIGWLLGLVAGIIAIFVCTPKRLVIPLYFAFLVVMVAALLAVSYWKGERPRWRWGESGDAPE